MSLFHKIASYTFLLLNLLKIVPTHLHLLIFFFFKGELKLYFLRVNIMPQQMLLIELNLNHELMKGFLEAQCCCYLGNHGSLQPTRFLIRSRNSD